MTFARLLALSLLLVSLARAQIPDANFWNLRPGAATSYLEVHDAALNQIASFPLPAFPFPSVAKSPQGTVWVAVNGTLVPYSGVVPGAQVAGAGVQCVAATAGSGVWTLEGSLVRLRDAQGAVLQSWPHGLSSAVWFLVPDALGGVWIFDGGTNTPSGQVIPGQVVRLDGSGVVTVPLTPVAGQPFEAVTDRQGRAWTLTGDTTVEVYGPAGVVQATFTPPGFLRGICIDPLGRPRVLGDLAGSNVLYTVDLAGVTSTLALPAGPVVALGSLWERVRVDHLGRIWLLDGYQNIQVLDRDGVPLASASGSVSAGYYGGAFFTGDQTTVAMTGILLPTADSDGDGFTNDTEIRCGSDALDPTSMPPTVQASPIVAGQSGAFTLLSPTEPGYTFILAASQGTTGFTLSELSPLTVPLTQDPLFDLWLSPLNVFVTPGVAGILDGTGAATLGFAPPLGSANISFFVSAVTLDLGIPRIGSVTPPTAINIF